MGTGMRLHEITHSQKIPDAHPYTVVISIHPTLWSRLRRYIEASPESFYLIDRVQPEPDNLVAHVGCATETARSQFEAAWG